MRRLRKKSKRVPFTCAVCNRILYKWTVQIFEKNKYQVENSSVFDYMVCRADGKQYICILLLQSDYFLGQCPKIKGAICNVPINADDICKVLPRDMDNNGVLQLYLKKWLNFKSHVLFEAVRPKVVHCVLDFFKKK